MNQTPPPTQPARPVSFRRPLLLSGTVALALLALWGWRWATAPPLPRLALVGRDPAVVEAITSALDRVRQDRRSGAAWGRLGMVLEAHALRAEAAECLAQAARLDPDEPRWPYLLGVQLRVEEPEKALPHLRRGVELADHADLNPAPRLRLAETLLQLNRLDEAEEEYRKVGQQPDNSRRDYGLGLLALARDDLATARVQLVQASQSPCCRRKALAQLAQLAQRQGSPDAADLARRANLPPLDLPWLDPYFSECQRLDASPQTRFREAQRLEAQGQRAEMDQAYRNLVQAFPEGRSYLAQGSALARLGDMAGAEEAFRQTLGQADLQVPAQFSLGALLTDQAEQLSRQPDQRDACRARAQEAVEHLQQALRRKPDHALAHLKLGQALRLLGRDREAIAAFHACVECRPELAEGHLLLGQALAQQGQRDAALAALEQAVQLSGPGDTRARKALEDVPRKQGD